MARKGITPVIATVLLLMLAVGAVGGAFAFIQGLQGSVIEKIKTRQNTDTKVNSINCYTHKGGGETGAIEIDISNTGSTALDLDPVSFNVRMPNGNINYTLSHRGVSFSTAAVRASTTDGIKILRTGGAQNWPNPSSYAVYQINATKQVKMESNVPYSITMSLSDMGHTITTNCQAENPS